MTSSRTRTEPRFAVDCMLGKLARALRAAGYDTWYDPFALDEELARRAEAEARILLTRDTHLLARRGAARRISITSDHVREQFAQVRREVPLELNAARPLTRCMECNGLLEPAGRDEVWAQVPPFIYLTHHRYRRCRDCGRVFWAGTHVERIQKLLARLMASGPQ